MDENYFEAIWRDISRIDAVPHVRLPVGSDDVTGQLLSMLTEFADGSDLLVDSRRLAPRPARFAVAEVPHLIELHRSCLEFVAILECNPTRYWAVTEEEYEWQVYTNL